MKTGSLPLLALLALPAAVLATNPSATVKQGAPGCMTSTLLDQFLAALLNNNQAAGEKLLKDGCVILNQDVQAEVQDIKGDDILVRVTSGKGPELDMWVPAKYVQQ